MAQESVLRIVIDSRNAERNARALASELDSIEKKGDFASKSMDSMSVATRQLAGYMAGLVTVSATINKMDAYTNLQNRLKIVTNSQQELNQAMGDTFGIAQTTRQEWETVTQVYQRFSDNAKTLGINMEQTAKLTETVSKAVAISGASTQAAEAALTQFGQALASGVLRGEELNSVMEQTPALAKAIAQGMGVTIGQLRSMAAEGKITNDVIVKALEATATSVDDLFQRTDATIGQSLSLLSNELTKFIGEAGQSSGAANLLAGSIKLLSENLSLLADAAVVGGIGYITKAILTKTVAVHGAITASVAQKAADTAEAQSSVVAATAKVNEAKAHLANVQATNAETQAKYGATAANARYKLASDAVTQALIAQTAAQNALNTSTSIGSKAFGLIGGPVGAITLGVTALAAGYMYLQKRTAEANAKLEEQGRVAEKTKEELLALKGVQLDVAKDDLAASFEDQNDKLNKLNLSFNGFIRTVKNANEGNQEVKEISDQVHKGLMSQADAIERLNKLKLLTPEQKSQGLDLIKSYEEARVKAQQNADAQKTLGQQVTLSGNAASNAVGKVNDNTNAMYNNADAANAAADAQSKYISNLQKGAAQTIMTNKLIAKGWEIERAKMASQAAFENGGKVSAKDIQIIDMNIAANKKLQASEDAIANAKRGSAKAASAALSQHRKDVKEANRVDEEQRNLREQYIYAYADREKQIELNLAKEIAEIHKANFTNPEPYLEAANKRAYYEKQIYLSQLQFEINEFQMSEEQKLKYSYDIKNLQLHQNSEITKESKEIAINALEEQYNQELALIKLSQETRLFQMREAFMSETAAMQERYRLEREQILLNSKLSQEQKQREIALSKALQEEENRRRLNNAVQQWGGIQAEMNGTGDQYRLEQERFSRYDASQDVFDAQMSQVDQAAQDPNANMQEIAAQREAIWQAHHDRMQAIESAYQTSSYNLQLGYGQQVTGALSGMFGAMLGESSSAYRALYGAQQAFALSMAGMNVWKSASDAYANEPGTVWQKIGAAAKATLDQGTFVAMIQAATPKGFANGGYTGHGGKYEPAGVVHKGEGVLTQEEVKALGGPQGFEDLRKSIRRGYATGGLVTDTHRVGMGAVNAINSGGGNSSSSGDVNITVNVTDSGVTTQSNQSDQKQLGQMIGNAVRTVIRQEQRQGGLLAK